MKKKWEINKGKVGKRSNRVQINSSFYKIFPVFYVLYVYFPLTSGVPQKVEVVPSASTPSLHRPKSVSTTWPCMYQIQTCDLFIFQYNTV